jgi:hypothetical protein
MKTAAEILPILKRWQSAVQGVNKQLGALKAVTFMAPESPLNVAVDGVCILATEWAANRIGLDSTGWLEWFEFENAFGAKNFEAGFDGELKPIGSLEEFADLLAEDVKRDAITKEEK